jgi:SAM-dependent methyltransferase
MGTREMGEFWDRRAGEDPYYFVHSEQEYGRPDMEAFWGSGEEALSRLLSALGVELRQTDTVVEIGCGVGRVTRAIAARAGRILALDVSERMLELAREHNPELANVEWVHGDGASLRPVADGAADAVISHVVFQHIPDSAVSLGYVTEMGRVLGPGGWAGFVFSNDPAPHDPGHGPGWRQRVRASLGRAPRGQGAPEWLGSALEVKDVWSNADAAGLDLERTVGERTQYCAALLRKRPETGV